MAESIYHKTFGNAAALAMGAGVEAVLQFVFLLVAGRMLGPVEFGYYGYLLSFVSFAVVIVQFALQVIAVREIAGHQEGAAVDVPVMAAVFRVRASFAAVFFIGAVAAALFSHDTMDHRTAIFLMFAYVLFVPLDLAPLFDAHKLSRWDVPGKISGRTASLLFLLGAWFLRGGLTVADVAAASSLLMAVNVAVGLVMARRVGLAFRPFAKTGETARLFRLSVPIAWATLATTIYLYSQTILVQWLSTALETGFYALANRLMMPLFVLKGILYRLQLPLLSEVAHDRAAYTARLERIIPALALLFMPLTALGVPAVQALLVPLFGAQYAGAVIPLQISLSHLFFTGWGSVFGAALFALGFQRTYTWSLTAGCAAALGCGVLLIPEYGAVGAAWSAWIAETLAVLITIPPFLKESRPRVGWRLLRIAIASGAGTAGFYLLHSADIVPMGMSLAAAVVIVVAGLRVAGELSASHLQVLLSLVRKPASQEE